MKRVSPTTWVIVAGVGCFLVGHWFLVLPKFRELGTALNQLNIQEEHLSAGPDADERAERLLAVTELSDTVRSLVPPTDQQSDVSVQIEAAANQSGASLMSLVLNTGTLNIPNTSTATEGVQGVEKLAITATVSGSYEQIRGFVDTLTSLERLILIDQLSVSASEEGGSQLTAEILANAFYAPEPKLEE